jgi:repressor LexA
MNDTNRKTAERLRLCREQAHETLDQIGALVGVNKSTVLRWENGQTTKINRPTLQRLAQHFDVDEAWLAGEDVPRHRECDWLSGHALSMDELIDLPVWGTTQTGLVRQSPPDAGDSANPWDNGYFWIRMSGDSMAPLIGDGDLILVRRQSNVDSGNYAVLLLDNEECMVRRIVHGDDFIELQSSNPYYPPCRFCGTDALRVHILGLVIESKRRFV